MPGPVPEVRMGLPPVEPWQRNLVVALFVAYVVEVLLYQAGVPIYDWLPWYSFGDGFAPWQLVTHFLVQGADLRIAGQLVIALVFLYFFLPAVSDAVDRRTMAIGTVAAGAGAIALPLLVDATGVLPARPALGWTPLAVTLPVLIGLAAPDKDLFLVFFPLKARVLLWGSLVVALLYLLVQPDLGTFEGVGAWLGVVGWWHLLGPGARRRTLRDQARDIESELRRFQVIEGGKDKPQGRQGGGDDWVH